MRSTFIRSSMSGSTRNGERRDACVAGLNAGPSIEAGGLWQDSWDRIRDNRAAILGGSIVLAIVVFSCIGPWLVSLYNGFEYDTLGLENRLANPSWQHPLGTDILGRDLLARLLYGSRISLMVGFISTSISLVIGVVLRRNRRFRGPARR